MLPPCQWPAWSLWSLWIISHSPGPQCYVSPCVQFSPGPSVIVVIWCASKVVCDIVITREIRHRQTWQLATMMSSLMSMPRRVIQGECPFMYFHINLTFWSIQILVCQLHEQPPHCQLDSPRLRSPGSVGSRRSDFGLIIPTIFNFVFIFSPRISSLLFDYGKIWFLTQHIENITSKHKYQTWQQCCIINLVAFMDSNVYEAIDDADIINQRSWSRTMRFLFHRWWP